MYGRGGEPHPRLAACHSEGGAAPKPSRAPGPWRRPRNLLRPVRCSAGRAETRLVQVKPRAVCGAFRRRCGGFSRSAAPQPPARSRSVTGTSKRPSVMTMVLVSPVDQSVLTAVPEKVPRTRPSCTDWMVMVPLVNE